MKRRGMTLLETLLAVAIIVVIVGTVYAFYHHSIYVVRSGRAYLLEAQLSRVILQHIADQIRHAPGLQVRFGNVLAGERDSISFLTTTVPSKLVFFPTTIIESIRPVEHDLRRIEYRLAVMEDEQAGVEGSGVIILGLRREELRALLAPVVEKTKDEELAGIESESEEEGLAAELGAEAEADVQVGPIILEEIISERIRYLEFQYYDGRDWRSRWTADVLPRAVRIIIGFKEVPENELSEELNLPWSERPWRDDQYSLIVPLILSEELKAKYVPQEEEETE